MDYCPKCKAKISAYEKGSGKCVSCGNVFDVSLFEKLNEDNNADSADNMENIENAENVVNVDDDKNSIAQALKVCGIIIMIVGTIASFVVANAGSLDYEFSFSLFIVPEAVSIISGLLFLGFSETIQLLQDIKDKLE